MQNPFPHPFRAADAKFLNWAKPEPDVKAMLEAAFRVEVSGGANMAPDSITILESPLKFYKDVSIIALTVPGSDQDLFFFRTLEEMTFEFLLFGNNEPIYSMTEKVGLILTRDSQIEYARFFFHFVRGVQGHFQVVEDPSDIQWDENVEEKIIQETNELLIPMTYRGLQPDGFHRNTAMFLFKNCLVKSDILVAGRSVKYREVDPGQTHLADEQFLLEDLPVKSLLGFKEASD